MAHYIRYFIVIISFLASMTAYAVDHILCHLTNAGIPAQVQAGQIYSNTYTCQNTYPASFPAVKLAGHVLGQSANTALSGTCTGNNLASGASCQFILKINLQKAGSVSFYLQVSVGSQYYLNLPQVTTSVNPVSGITWPGSASGLAQVDDNGVGSGFYIPDATDSSGHPVTYTFQLSGVGSVTGNQHGSFSLTAIDSANPGTITVTANADDAAPVVGTPIPIAVNKIPAKVIAFYNNSTETIYPVIEAPILSPVDPWLQAGFLITDTATYTFQSTKIHRAYVNATNGIPPGQKVLVSVPFYSELVGNPSGGNVPDQYVDWWNAMRIYIYDVQSNLINQYNADSANPVTLFTAGPGCISGPVCSGPLSVFSSTTGVPTNDPQQLTEYTFADVVTSVGTPYPIDYTHVDYDYSGVDQIYLPVAMEPYGSSLVGYTGTVIDLLTFRNNMGTFLSDTGWPVYSGLPYPRIPGAYNVVVNNPQLTEPEKTNTSNAFLAWWNTCFTSVADPLHSQCLQVNDLFQKNYNVCSAGSPTQLDLIQHIYGWVSFTSCGLNPLASTPGADYPASESAYHTLQYAFHPDYTGDFNPYVQLVHTALGMNVYAYSIDDAVGNINTIGDGVVIAVGGGTGLSNPLQYDTNKITTVGPGTPPPGSPDPVFTRFGVCSSSASTGLLARGAPFSFQLADNKYPCEITLQDSNDVLYHFTVLSAAPFTNPPTSNYISCVNGDNWCAAVTIDFNTHLNIGTPVPTA